MQWVSNRNETLQENQKNFLIKGYSSNENFHCTRLENFKTFRFLKESHQGLVNVSDISHCQDLSTTFTCSLKVTKSLSKPKFLKGLISGSVLQESSLKHF